MGGPVRYFSRVSIKPAVQLTSLCTSVASSPTLHCILHSIRTAHGICSDSAHSVHCGLVLCLIQYFIANHSQSLQKNTVSCSASHCCEIRGSAKPLQNLVALLSPSLPMYVLFCWPGLPDKDMTS